MMYVVFIIDYIHHLMNEPRMLIFAYNSDRRVYLFKLLFQFLEYANINKWQYLRELSSVGMDNA
jgi:hypothetical protein